MQIFKTFRKCDSDSEAEVIFASYIQWIWDLNWIKRGTVLSSAFCGFFYPFHNTLDNL